MVSSLRGPGYSIGRVTIWHFLRREGTAFLLEYVLCATVYKFWLLCSQIMQFVFFFAIALFLIFAVFTLLAIRYQREYYTVYSSVTMLLQAICAY